MQLSKYVTRQEFEASQTAVRFGLNNTMNSTQLVAAKYLCTHVVDMIRDYYKRPVLISSGYRSPLLNRHIGGSTTSQHCLGEAVDFTVLGVSVDQVFNDIRSGKIPGLVYDQLIHEFGSWVHISIKQGKLNRRENLRAVRQNGRTVYLAA